MDIVGNKFLFSSGNLSKSYARYGPGWRASSQEILFAPGLSDFLSLIV